MSAGLRVVRNAGFLLGSQPLTWALSLAFMVLVPRNLGPGEWGEWAVAWAIGLVARSVLDLGVNTVLLKEVARQPDLARRQLGAVIALRLLLAPLLVLGIVGFAIAAGYGPHTRAVVLVVALTLGISYVGTPVVFGLQAFEKMHVTALAGVLTNFLMTAGAVLLLKVLTLGVISIAVVALVANLAGLLLEWAWLRREVPIRPVFDAALIRHLVRAGVPYFAAALFFTVYVWVDSVLLSLWASRTEVGWYSVAAQLISALGFLPYAITTAVLPALARSFHRDADQSGALASRSFLFVTAAGMPMTAGLALVATPLVVAVYGAWFSPAGAVLTILALTLIPVYVATLVNGFIVAADRQALWTGVMGAMCAVNPALNLVTIPFFHARGNGALGAAVALLVTDCLTGVLAVVLLPRRLRAAITSVLPRLARALVATAAMSAVVWPLRELPVPVPIAGGLLAFAGAALLLRVFPDEDLRALRDLARATLGRRGRGGPGIEPVREADPAA